MKKRTLLSGLFVALVIFLVCGTFDKVSAQGKIQWKTTTTWEQGNPLSEGDKHFLKLVQELAPGEIDIKYFPGGSLIPALEIFGAVEKGTIDAGFEAPKYWTGKNTAFEPLGSYPMGLTPIDYLVWIYQGGGFEVYQEVYGKFGMVYLPITLTTMESGLRSRKEVKTLADYKGLKLRMGGRIEGLILKDLGASETVLSIPEVYQALEKGVIQGTAICTPDVDWSSGLQEVTKYWSAPGWHQPASVLGLAINKKSWDKLSSRLQSVLKTAAMYNLAWSFTFYEYRGIEYTKKFVDKGTKISRLSDKDLAQITKIVNKHTLQSCKENPLLAKVIYSQFKFINDVTQWRGIAVPFTYGRNFETPDLNAIKSYIK